MAHMLPAHRLLSKTELSEKRTNISQENGGPLSRAESSEDRIVGRHMRRNAQRLTAAQRWLLDPPPGSKAAAAKAFGIDLTLNARLLGLTPEERIAEMQNAVRSLHSKRKSQ
jgi:hypothetical protein